MVELLDLREADVHLRPALAGPGGDHLRQAMQGLRAEHDVDIGCALDDGRTFLTGHAAADADQRALFLQVLDAPEVGEDLFLRLFAHRAGVEEDQVGLFDIGGGLVTLGGAQHVGHLVRVVLVHLAAEGADEDLLHGRLQTWVSGLKDQMAASRDVVGQGLRDSSAGVSTHTSSRWPCRSSV